LPSGEAIARAPGLNPCTANELRTTDANWPETSLWLYVLAEAETQHNGERLGELGGRIVPEVIFELLRKDPTSFLSDPNGRPELAGAGKGFAITDLLELAAVA
jgi:hypothetical protein